MTWGEGNANEADRAAKASAAIQLKISGLTWPQVAAQLKAQYGQYGSAGAAFNLVKWALKQARSELAQGLEELRQVEDLRDDDLRRRLYAIISRPHPLVQNGKIVKDDEGVPLRDDGPVLAAIDRLSKIADRHARRWGLDAPRDLNIALERRTDLEGAVVAEAILAGFDAAGLPPDARRLALEAAMSRLEAIDGDVVSEGPDEAG